MIKTEYLWYSFKLSYKDGHYPYPPEKNEQYLYEVWILTGVLKTNIGLKLTRWLEKSSISI